MRELHVVAMSEDGRHVVLATSKNASNGGFKVPIDDRLSAAVRGDLPRPGEERPAEVTPKEIQARLRAGESPEEIAASAGVPVTKIERYAGPVLSERERVLEQARAGFVSRSRLGESALPLGEAVDRHLADTVGVRLETVEWMARREDTGTWLVELRYVSQARRRSAVWRYDVARREVTATDAASAALAHVEPGGRRSRSSEHELAMAQLPARRPARRAAPAARKAVRKATPARTVAARPAAPARVAAPAQERAARAAAEKAAEKAAAAAARKAKAAAEKKAKAAAEKKAKAAAEKKARAAEERKAKAAAEKKARAAAEKKARAAAEKKARTAAEKKAAAEEVPPGPPTLRVVGSDAAPKPRREPKEPPAAARTAPARAAGQRASVPGWADVLLSTAPVARPDTDED